jgi:hypothetical protein
MLWTGDQLQGTFFNTLSSKQDILSTPAQDQEGSLC